MIEKMKFVTFTGPKDDIDRVVSRYLTKYNIHLENALSELKGITNLKPFVETSPYRADVAQTLEILKLLPSSEQDTNNEELLPYEKAAKILKKASTVVDYLNEEKNKLITIKETQVDLQQKIEPFRHLDYNLKSILDFQFIKYRFGRVAHEHYNKFSRYVFDNLNTIFYECDSDPEYVWGVYFVPVAMHLQVDAIYSSLHFERIFIPDEYNGTPDQAYKKITSSIQSTNEQIAVIDKKLSEALAESKDNLILAYNTFYTLDRNFDVRKKAACTREKKQVFYIICGWIGQEEAKTFEEEIKHDPKVFYVLEDDHSKVDSKPPTKLKNKGIFKPFEMFINMYSLPNYHEMDPTKFVAISYSLMFGIMFGDVGQGILLVLGGFYFYKKKHMNLGAILSLAGCFSTAFGFLYGSLFGYEHILPTLWMKPMENIMTTLIIAVAFGVGLILIAIILNIINAIRAKELGRLLFDTNGIAGLVFYSSVLIAAVLIFTGKLAGGIGILGVFIGIPLILIFLKEPLTHFVEKKAEIFPENKGMFFVESFFELFEILLSYVTNSISFVRIGAFALSHAGMMEVVMMLGKATTGEPNYVIIILGNILVMGLEGLIVGIQVLRLEYYEMFSRFYTGNGREFVPYKQSLNKR